MKKMRVCLILLLLAGCAARQPEIFTEKVLETSKDSSKPEWVFKTFRETKGGYEFSGGVTDASNYALGVSEARAEAIKNAVISVQINVGSEFTKFVEGSNMAPEMIGKWVSDGIAFLSDSLRVSGITHREIYFEKVRYNTEYKPHYNVWALCSISSVDHMKAKIDAAQRLVNKYRNEKNEQAKKKAKELLDRLRKESMI